jgi:hypothetical protein
MANDDQLIDLADPLTDAGEIDPEAEKTDPEDADSEDRDGHQSNPELIENEDILQDAHNEGLYSQDDGEHPVPLNIAEEIQKRQD